MPPHSTRPPFASGAQGQPAGQAAAGPALVDKQITRATAERHEALWLAVSALHKDIVVLGSRRPAAPVSQPVRIAAEGLLGDCAPFIRRQDRLAVAAADMAGLAVQLGQALSGLDAWQSQRSYHEARYNCRMWRLAQGQQPIMRLKPPLAAMPVHRDPTDLRQQLARRIESRRQSDFERGFQAGRAARQGRPPGEIEAGLRQTYPHLRLTE